MARRAGRHRPRGPILRRAGRVQLRGPADATNGPAARHPQAGPHDGGSVDPDQLPPPGQAPPYEDAEGPDGLLRYKYRGIDRSHPENVALRQAFDHGLPLVWFVAAAAGAYVPVYPIWIVGDEPAQLQFVVAFDVAQRLVSVGDVGDETQRLTSNG